MTNGTSGNGTGFSRDTKLLTLVVAVTMLLGLIVTFAWFTTNAGIAAGLATAKDSATSIAVYSGGITLFSMIVIATGLPTAGITAYYVIHHKWDE